MSDTSHFPVFNLCPFSISYLIYIEIPFTHRDVTMANIFVSKTSLVRHIFQFSLSDNDSILVHVQSIHLTRHGLRFPAHAQDQGEGLIGETISFLAHKWTCLGHALLHRELPPCQCNFEVITPCI